MGDWSAYIPQIQACSADDGGGIFSLDGAPWCQYGSVSLLPHFFSCFLSVYLLTRPFFEDYPHTTIKVILSFFLSILSRSNFDHCLRCGGWLNFEFS